MIHIPDMIRWIYVRFLRIRGAGMREKPAVQAVLNASTDRILELETCLRAARSIIEAGLYMARKVDDKSVKEWATEARNHINETRGIVHD